MSRRRKSGSQSLRLWLGGLAIASLVSLILTGFWKKILEWIRGTKTPQEPKVPTKMAAKAALHEALRNAGFNEDVIPYIIAQSALETGFWSSKMYREALNPWGMMKPLKRMEISCGSYTQQGTGAKFQRYCSLEDAAKDLALWWQFHGEDPAFLWFAGLRSYVDYLSRKDYIAPVSADEYYNALKPVYEQMCGND